jgi:hypothetical protein
MKIISGIEPDASWWEASKTIFVPVFFGLLSLFRTRSSGKKYSRTRATLKTTRPTILLRIVACVFVTAVTFLPSRCLATAGEFIPNPAVA